MLRIYYDAYQEGMWFKKLHPALSAAELHPFPEGRSELEDLGRVLAYDRPDIVLTDETRPILVVERTIEVPSGHNVGQRFARLAAAAQSGVPCVYFGPYAAYKHGGETSGPRFMNLRLFQALDAVMAIEECPVTTIRWPVDAEYEIIQQPRKDDRLREYLTLFFTEYERNPRRVASAILNSEFERQQEEERQRFVSREVKRSADYDGPPPSLEIGRPRDFGLPAAAARTLGEEIVFYRVGMRYIRSDPYTGMAILYAYLYCGGLRRRLRPLVLWFPYISVSAWQTAARRGGGTKTIRLFRLVSDGILFADGYLSGEEL
jgi:hypothetical protein